MWNSRITLNWLFGKLTDVWPKIDSSFTSLCPVFNLALKHFVADYQYQEFKSKDKKSYLNLSWTTFLSTWFCSLLIWSQDAFTFQKIKNACWKRRQNKVNLHNLLATHFEWQMVKIKFSFQSEDLANKPQPTLCSCSLPHRRRRIRTVTIASD